MQKSLFALFAQLASARSRPRRSVPRTHIPRKEKTVFAPSPDLLQITNPHSTPRRRLSRYGAPWQDMLATVNND
eukprot:scaffold8105_cov112-Isochrysis_galbana.AAC.7